MTPTPESQSQRLLDTFTTAVNGVNAATALAEDARKSVQEGCAALVDQVRRHVHLRAFALRGLLMVEIKLHQLRTLAETDPRIQLLRELQSTLQGHATISSARAFTEAPVMGYVRSVTDSFTSGVPSERRTEAAATAVAGAATAGFGIFSAWQATQSTGKRFWAWLTSSVLSLTAFAGLGAVSNVRASTGQTGSPEGETRTAKLDAPGSSETFGGVTLSRIAGGSVVVVHGGRQFSITLPTIAASAGRAEVPAVSISAMMPRVFTSPSTGTGIGVEQPSTLSRVSLALPEVFRIAGTGFTAMQTALAAGPVPAEGVSATIPLSFRIQHITPSQVEFIRRCIAAGATMDANNEWLTVNAPIRLVPLSAPTTTPPLTPAALGTPERAVNDLAAAAAQTAIDGIAGVTNATLATTATSPANNATIQGHLKTLHDIIDAVPLANRNAAMTKAANDLLARAAVTARGDYVIQGGSRFTLAFSGWRFNFAPAAAPSAFAAVIKDLRDNGTNRLDALLTAMDNNAPALTTHVGNPGTQANIATALGTLNALIPAGGARTDTGVATAATTLLNHPVGDPAKDRTYAIGAGATIYRLRFHAATGQFRFES